jgi:hypothetical protein
MVCKDYSNYYIKGNRLQNPSKMNGDNLNDTTHGTSKTFRNKERDYLKDKINALETNN